VPSSGRHTRGLLHGDSALRQPYLTVGRQRDSRNTLLQLPQLSLGGAGLLYSRTKDENGRTNCAGRDKMAMQRTIRTAIATVCAIVVTGINLGVPLVHETSPPRHRLQLALRSAHRCLFPNYRLPRTWSCPRQILIRESQA
jgi:hypothetical protein